jgi:hypothetical protein
MAKKQPMELAGYRFESKSAVEKFLKTELYKPPGPPAAKPSDEPGKFVISANLFALPFHVSAVMFDLLKQHPFAEEKTGTGVSHFEGEILWEERRRFVAVRLDWSRCAVSYKTCLSGFGNRYMMFYRAARNAIRDQVIRFRRMAFENHSVLKCPITGEDVSLETSHVDHEDPQFSQILDMFLDEFGRVYSDYPLSTDGDSEMIVFKDAQDAKLFSGFHENVAKLRILSARGNTTRPKIHPRREKIAAAKNLPQPIYWFEVGDYVVPARAVTEKIEEPSGRITAIDEQLLRATILFSGDKKRTCPLANIAPEWAMEAAMEKDTEPESLAEDDWTPPGASMEEPLDVDQAQDIVLVLRRVEAMVIKHNNGHLEIHRSADGWRVFAGTPGEKPDGSTWLVGELYDALTRTIDAWAPPRAKDEDQP